MLVVQNQRADRAALQATLRELQEALERAGLAEGTGAARKPFAKPQPRPAVVAAVHDAGDDLTQEVPLPEPEPTPTVRKPRVAPQEAPQGLTGGPSCDEERARRDCRARWATAPPIASTTRPSTTSCSAPPRSPASVGACPELGRGMMCGAGTPVDGVSCA